MKKLVEELRLKNREKLKLREEIEELKTIIFSRIFGIVKPFYERNSPVICGYDVVELHNWGIVLNGFHILDRKMLEELENEFTFEKIEQEEGTIKLYFSNW